MCVLVIQSCSTFYDPMDYIACQAPLSMGFSRQEYWSGLLCPSPGDLPDPGINPRSPTLRADSLLSKSNHTLTWWKIFFQLFIQHMLFFVLFCFFVSCSFSYLEYMLNMSRKDLWCHVADIVAEENKKNISSIWSKKLVWYVES